MIADTMLSKESTETTSINFPTLRPRRPRAAIRSGKTFYVVPALSQKIVKVSSNMFVGWAGPLCCAVEAIKFFIEECKGGDPGPEEVERMMDEFNKWKHPELELSTICLHGTRWRPFTGGGGLVLHPDLGEVHVLGSGTQHFTNHLYKDRFVPFGGDFTSFPDNVDTLHYALEFMSKAMSRQREFDYGLDRRWGAALEVLALRNGLEKIGNILYQTYRYKIKERKLVLKPFSNKVFTFYHDEHFVVETYNLKDGVQEYVIPPPQSLHLGLAESSDISRPTSPELTVTTVIEVNDWSKRRTFVEWNAAGVPYARLDLSRVGGAIEFDEERVSCYIQYQLGLLESLPPQKPV